MTPSQVLQSPRHAERPEHLHLERQSRSASLWGLRGNLLSDGSATFAYDVENRLISTTLSGVNTQFAYNGDGIRLRLVEVGVPTTL